jgi:anti-sigma B factor antagonist
MKAEFYCDNGATTIRINEERIDIQNADQLREILLDQIYNGHTEILVDLSKVQFIDSSGLGALVYGLREARRKRGSVRVTGLSAHVSSMFTITRLNKIFEIVSPGRK